MDGKKSNIGAGLCSKINEDGEFCADFFPSGGSLSDFFYWRAGATGMIGTLTQRTAVADCKWRCNAFA